MAPGGRARAHRSLWGAGRASPGREEGLCYSGVPMPPRFSSEEIAARGQALYERDIRHRLGADTRGKFLVLDIESEEYEVDADERAAVQRVRAKHPDAVLYLLRIGQPSAYRLGRKAVAAAAC
jgi:hypothetical protein